jgi:hypothetical protein
MLAIRTIEAITPAVASETAPREIALNRDAAGASALVETAADCEADASLLVEAAIDGCSRFGCLSIEDFVPIPVRGAGVIITTADRISIFGGLKSLPAV